MLNPQRVLIIDEEGYFVVNDKRLADEEIGASLLESIIRKERGSFTCRWDEEEIILEPFDEPLVVQRVDRIENTENTGSRFGLMVTFPYNVRQEVVFETLSVDEWDRFHGRTVQGIPYVFSRKAQAQLFDVLDSFDDDSIEWQGKAYPVRPWLSPHPEIQSSQFWTGLYHDHQDGWDLHAPAPALVDMLPRLKLPKSRILVLGCGRGNDAAFFAECGHVVTAVDFSPQAIQEGKERYKHLSNIHWFESDIFNLPSQWQGQFDLIFEHTCYCAIDPAKRQDLVRIWNRLLHSQGQVMGVFFVMDRPNGPPYGGTEWELRERLKKTYQFQFWGRWKKSEPRRQGTELFVLGTKKPQ